MEVPLDAGRLPTIGTYIARPHGWRPGDFQFGESSEDMSMTPDRDPVIRGQRERRMSLSREPEEEKVDWREPMLLSREPLLKPMENTLIGPAVGLVIIIAFWREFGTFK